MDTIYIIIYLSYLKLKYLHLNSKKKKKKRNTKTCSLVEFNSCFFCRDMATMDENGYVKIIGRIKVCFQ